MAAPVVVNTVNPGMLAALDRNRENQFVRALARQGYRRPPLSAPPKQDNTELLALLSMLMKMEDSEASRGLAREQMTNNQAIQKMMAGIQQSQVELNAQIQKDRIEEQRARRRSEAKQAGDMIGLQDRLASMADETKRYITDENVRMASEANKRDAEYRADLLELQNKQADQNAGIIRRQENQLAREAEMARGTRSIGDLETYIFDTLGDKEADFDEVIAETTERISPEFAGLNRMLGSFSSDEIIDDEEARKLADELSSAYAIVGSDMLSRAESGASLAELDVMANAIRKQAGTVLGAVKGMSEEGGDYVGILEDIRQIQSDGGRLADAGSFDRRAVMERFRDKRHEAIRNERNRQQFYLDDLRRNINLPVEDFLQLTGGPDTSAAEPVLPDLTGGEASPEMIAAIRQVVGGMPQASPAPSRAARGTDYGQVIDDYGLVGAAGTGIGNAMNEVANVVRNTPAAARKAGRSLGGAAESGARLLVGNKMLPSSPKDVEAEAYGEGFGDMLAQAEANALSRPPSAPPAAPTVTGTGEIMVQHPARPGKIIRVSQQDAARYLSAGYKVVR